MTLGYLPEIGDIFNAFVKTSHKLVFGSPFTCNRIRQKKYVVIAKDIFNEDRMLDTRKVYFEKVEK